MTSKLSRPSRLFTLGLLALLTLAACNAAAVAGESVPASDPGGAGGGQPPAACESCDPIDPDRPVVGQPGPALPPNGDGATHVTPQPGVRDAIPHAIDHVSVAADGRTVTVYWWGGVEDCYGLKEVRVARDANGLLTLTVLEGARGDLGEGVACIDIALLKATTITLDEPLFADGSAE